MSQQAQVVQGPDPHEGPADDLVLVDGAGTIRGYYASMDADTPARLIADLDRLGTR